ncbi:non-ribosomal peptide synthetase [Actinokineospora iranica]|uniref:Acyl-CoA synthetase (AMP-forming)/AMP-acid ligase II n=1 Tax=Actinokineospora iranica TaxID=1271860 RepID=A0A1G6INC9_9PSEU|nr:non-ribosomal peptide synthetase [Actinokineospora iranica]SDC07953.1 Acyl-CoA synthetase (AMP-forming)/AMP-acid ligase II [Actinokineospora iranica]
MPAPSAPQRVGVPLAEALAGFGDRPALIGRDTVTSHEIQTTYRELAARVAETAERLGTTRRLVLVAAGNAVEPIVAYLAALRAGHPVLLAAPDRVDALVEAYDPDVVVRDDLRERRAGSAHDLHPDLALLLSTSGSTGSPKLVRLSAANVQANAEAIATYLDIRDTDRAATTLPMHYCYGLSVLNSNLLRGAAVLLDDRSVVDPGFWADFRARGGTSVHGVPHTFDLLDRAGFGDLDLPSLRYVTQAGGRLAPERVRHYARLAERGGWRFYVMYGQTEATARMAYLPSELAAARPEAIGVPIPGGSFEIRPSGELVYRGPNVMLGYARTPADLALGATLDALPTGDLARRADDGLYEVIGRASRFVKPFGLRVDLDEVERVLAAAGFRAAVAGDDTAITLGLVSGQDSAAAAALVRRKVGLPEVHVREFAALPRLATGKVDYAAITAPAEDAPVSVRRIYERVLHRPRIADDDTFVSLGGDSLTYVRVSIALEKALGHVPDGWHTMAVGDLERLRPRARRLRSVETNIVLRAAAIALVVSTHIGVTQVWGGAHLLLAIAGWSFARFALAAPDRVPGRVARAAARIAAPAVLWLAWRATQADNVTVANVLLVNNYARTGTIAYWYVEALVQILLLMALLFAVPAIRRLQRAHGFAVALAVLVAALVAAIPAGHDPVFSARDMSTHGVLWLFALGWAAQRAATDAQRLAVIVLTLVLVPGHFEDPLRDAIVGGGLLLVLLVPRLSVPAPVVRLVGLLAGASLYLYLTHYVVFLALLPHLPKWTVLAVTLAVGVAGWRLVCRVGQWAAQTRSAWSPACAK